MAQIHCRHFSGYKPCKKSDQCDSQCRHYDAPRLSILIVHLGALGAVVRSTSLLRAIKRKYPSSMITWVTDSPAHKILSGHPLLDRVLTTAEADMLQISALEFDIGLVIDKSLKASGVLRRTTVDQIYGFDVFAKTGGIVPATAAAQELWELGLNDHKKFYINKKPETQLMIEALELGEFQRDEYFLPLSSNEEIERLERRRQWLGSDKRILLGINTGCSEFMPHKKWTVEFHRQVIEALNNSFADIQIVLLGGPEDTTRNESISQDLAVINSATTSGLRDGLVSVAACDIVLTGDSLGMHMAISQQKQVIAWFGPTCAHEIDLYDRGVKILSQSSCAPCWKRVCQKERMCYDQVSLTEIMNAVESSRTNCLSRGSAACDSSLEAL